MTQTHSWMKRTEPRFSSPVTQKVKEGEREIGGEKGRKEERERKGVAFKMLVNSSPS